MKVKMPKEAIGLIEWLSLRRMMRGATAAPNLPKKVQNPIPMLLIGVGYNSGPYT